MAWLYLAPSSGPGDGCARKTEERSSSTLKDDSHVISSRDSSQGSDITTTDEVEKAPSSALFDGSVDPKHPPSASAALAQDWTGPDDPENPHNWPLWQRIYTMSVPAIMAFVVTLSSSIYTPGVPDIMTDFHVSQVAALLGLALYVFGLGFGPVLAAPISETIGRSAVYRLSLPLSAVFTLGSGLSRNLSALLIARFFAGFFGGPVLAVGSGTIADCFPPVYRATTSAFFILSPFAGPAVGPIIGGFAAENKGWRWTQWIVLFLFTAVLLFMLPMKETHKNTILKRRRKRLGIRQADAAGPSGVQMLVGVLTITLFRPIHMIFTEPIVGFFALYVGFNFSVLFGFFDAFPIVFQGVYRFDRGHAGLSWVGVLIGCLLGVATVVVIDRRRYRRLYMESVLKGRNGLVAPEHRLYVSMIGSFGLPVGLFWFAWTARPDVHWISPVLASVLFGWGNICVFTGAVLYLVDTYGPLLGASAMAANGVTRYTMGAAFPLFTVQMYNRLGVPWATSLFGLISVALLPIPWVLFRFGSKIRAKSQYDTIKA